MESKTSSCIVLLALAISLGIFQMASAGDPDILTDFVMPLEVPSVDCFLLYLLRPEGPRTVSVTNSVFNTSIPDNILAKSFKTNIMTIQKLKAGLA
ncbi:hypothetical protein RND71_013250 [Anisodus tanguticus]|uniref:Uncharacterized protein n=1 Tax=Anisodus tanguticus TaxID=243964 RepID=A0AAE1VGT4_9SOLA|nr:hypothetical protein RND71_013250 [Anisodus tanguticus]